jgi:type IV pilus biogenesis/stability protein PilW
MSRKLFRAICTITLLGSIMIGCSSNTALFRSSNLSGSGPIIDVTQPTIETSIQYQARLRTELAAGYYSRKQYQVALEEVNNALAIDPKYGPAYGMLALIHSTLGDSIGAEKAFIRATEVAPSDPDIRNNFGAFLCERQRFKDSLAQFDIALRNPLYQTPQVALRNAAECAFKGGERQRAEVYYRRLGQPIPDAPSATNTTTQAANTNTEENGTVTAPNHQNEEINPTTPPPAALTPPSAPATTSVPALRPTISTKPSGSSTNIIVPAPRLKNKPSAQREESKDAIPNSNNTTPIASTPTPTANPFSEAAKAYAQGDLLKAQEWIAQTLKTSSVSADAIHLAMCIERRFANAVGEEHYADLLLSRYPKSPQTSLLNHSDKGCS